MNIDFLKNHVEQQLLQLHTCYLAKVLSVNGNFANIQPLSLIKSYGSNGKKQSVIENVPVCRHAVNDVSEGATVVAACMERDISRTRFGEFALPSRRRHNLSDSIIIGVIT